MIRSFQCRETEKVFRREVSRKLPREIQERAFFRLNAVDAAARLDGPWRICFVWQSDGAADVEIVDYH